MMFWFMMWVGSIIATGILSHHKGFSVVGFTFLAILIGPLALIIVVCLPSSRSGEKSSLPTQSFGDPVDELRAIKKTLAALQEKVKLFESAFQGKQEVGEPEPTGVENEKRESEILPETESLFQSGEGIISHEYVEVPSRLDGDSNRMRGDEPFEFRFGKYWLNRIGVVLFVVGIGLFIAYTKKFFITLGPGTKLAIGYALAVVLFLWGHWLEKKKRYTKVAWGVLGASWGLAYLVTYALHYVEATGLIKDPFVALFLLTVVTAAAIIYNIRYRSWVVTSLTFLLAFITIGLGSAQYSIAAYCALLVGSIVYLSYRFQWHAFFLVGVIGTYLTYTYWIQPQIFSGLVVTGGVPIQVYQFHLNFSVSLISWVLFSVGVFSLACSDRSQQRFLLAGTSLNALFFTVLGLDQIVRVMPHVVTSWNMRFTFLMGLGVLYLFFAYVSSRVKKQELVALHIAIAASLVALAVVVQAARIHVAFFWLIEMVVLLGLGIYYRTFLYRILAAILAFLIVWRLFWIDIYSTYSSTRFGFQLQHNVCVFLFASACFYAIGSILRIPKVKQLVPESEGAWFRAAIVVGTVLLTVILGKEMKAQSLSLTWGLQGAGILAVGFLLRDKVWRLCALSVVSLSCLHLIFVDLARVNTVYKIIGFTSLGALLVGVSFLYSKLFGKTS